MKENAHIESDGNSPTKREGEQRGIAAVSLGVLLGSPCESTDSLATTLFYSERRSSDELGRVHPRRRALPKAWAMSVSRDIKEGEESADRFQATVMYPLIDVGKIGKRVRRKCATQHGRPSEPYGSCPFPPRKGTFHGPVPISEGVCDELAAPFLPPRATIPREKENGAQQESENCPNIAACVDVWSLVPKERESGTRVNTHLMTKHLTLRHTQPMCEGKGNGDDRDHRAPPTDPTSIARPSLCSKSHGTNSNKR